MVTKVKCPTCQSEVEWGPQSPFRPFCSKRCQLIDLGEWADDFPSVSAEAKQELEDLLDAWARKNCDCSFYRVKNIETFKITHEDLEHLGEVAP